MAAPATAAPAGVVSAAPAVLSPGPVNGDLVAGLAGWDVLGAETPAPLASGRGVLVRGNVTLISPPVALPAGAQTLRVALRSPGGEGLVLVRARPESGGPEIDLGAVEPGPRRQALSVGVAALAGTTVRIVIDPVPALGTTLEVHRVGPVAAPLPGWAVARGLPDVTGARGRRVLRLTEEPFAARSPVVRPPRAARWLTAEVRGDGLVRLSAGGRTVAARGGAAWRTVRIPLARRGAAARVRVQATPGPDGVELRRVGVPLRTPGRPGGSGSR